MMRVVYKFRFTVLLFLCLFLVVSCTESKEESKAEDLPRVVTNEESQLLSRVLYENHLLKNASFSARSVDESIEFVAQGKVDWENELVELNVAFGNPSIIDLSAVTTNEVVYENYLGLDPSIDWVTRDHDASQFGIDALSLFVMKLASTSPDNPVLLRQDNAQYLGRERVGGQETLMLRSPGGIVFSVTPEGELKKVKASIKGFSHDIEFLFEDFSSTEIDVPSGNLILEIDQVSAFYFAKRPGF